MSGQQPPVLPGYTWNDNNQARELDQSVWDELSVNHNDHEVLVLSRCVNAIDDYTRIADDEEWRKGVRRVINYLRARYMP